MADILRLPDETLATAFIYIHKYDHFIRRDPDKSSPLDHFTLNLAALRLASLTLSTPRSPSKLIIPAYAILHPDAPPLSTSSPTYEKLRATLMRATTLLSRALGFKLLVSTPLDYLSTYLRRAQDWQFAGGVRLNEDGEDNFILDPMGGLSAEERTAQGVDDTRETRTYRACVQKVLRARAVGGRGSSASAKMVAAVAVAVVLRVRGLAIEDEDLMGENMEETRREHAKWIEWVTGESFNMDDWEICVGDLRNC